MENVPEVVGKNNIAHFKKWEEQLRKFGYSNYVEILNGKNYGIPQNRRRFFLFSILGDYSYDFPKRRELKYHLKDFLEDEVDEKYYLSQRMINFFMSNTEKQAESGNGFAFNPIAATDEGSIARTITTKAGSRMDDNFIIYEDEEDDSEEVTTHQDLKETLEGGGQTMKKLRIRKLTPKECMRLMGFTDEDYQALKDIGLSDSAIYHCAGDSIITTCLVGIISPLVNENDKHIDIINNYVEKIVKGE